MKKWLLILIGILIGVLAEAILAVLVIVVFNKNLSVELNKKSSWYDILKPINFFPIKIPLRKIFASFLGLKGPAGIQENPLELKLK